jgi:hypothetical protein
MPRASLRAVPAFDYGATRNLIKFPPLSGAYLKTPGFGRPRCDWRRRWPQMATLQNLSSKRSRPSYARHLADKMVDIRTRLAMPA